MKFHKKKIIAVILALSVLVASVFIAAEVSHICTDTNCYICVIITSCRQVCELCVGAAFYIAALLVIILSFVFFKIKYNKISEDLVTLKVKMTD